MKPDVVKTIKHQNELPSTFLLMQEGLKRISEITLQAAGEIERLRKENQNLRKLLKQSQLK